MITLEQEAASDPNKREALQQARIEHADTLETLRMIDYKAFTQLKHAEADIAGTLLARIVQDRPTPPTITHIKIPNGESVTTQKEINEAFNTYLRTLRSPYTGSEH